MVANRPKRCLLTAAICTCLPALQAPAANPRQTRLLDGQWQIRFDPDNVGRQQQWQLRGRWSQTGNGRSLRVPSCWEEFAQDYEGVAWYVKRFRAPGDWRGKAVRLRFGAVNYRAEVWLNDEVVGYHDGGYTPFEFAVGDLLQYGSDNFLVVRVVGPIIRRKVVIDGFGPNDMPHWRGAIAGGIWQSVALVATDRVYVKDIFVEPHIEDGSATLHVAVHNCSATANRVGADFRILSVGNQTDEPVAHSRQELNARPGTSKLAVRLKIDLPTYWSPDHPHLYVASVELTRNAAPIDRMEVRFGMREFTVRHNDYYLNGKRIYLKTGFWEGLYPNTLAYPPSEQFVRREIALAKRAGFNCLRPWRKPPVPKILDVADEMGMMLIDCPPVECMRRWPTATPQLRQRIANEIRGMVLRDRNHPSGIYWELFNEIARPCIGRLKRPMALLARSLDPTRLIVDESGGWFGQPGVYRPYSREPLPFNEIHSYLRSPVDDRTYNTYLHLGRRADELDQLGIRVHRLKTSVVPGRLTFLSEVGYGGLGDLEENVRRYQAEGNPLAPDYRYHRDLKQWLWQCIEQSGMQSVFGNISEFCLATQQLQAEGNKLQLEAVRLNPRIDGYCVHAFTGGDWVLGAGMLDIFRKPKQTFYTIQRVNRPLYLAIRTDKRNLRSGQDLVVTVTSRNEKAPCRGALIVEVLSEQGEVVYAAQSDRTIPAGIHPLAAIPLSTDDFAGLYRIRIRFEDALQNILSENEYAFRAVPPAELVPPNQAVAVVDPPGTLTQFLQNKGAAWQEFSENTAVSIPVLVTTLSTRNPGQVTRLKRTLQHVQSGGVAVYLNPNPGRNRSRLQQIMPYPVQLRRATGNWIPVAHVVKRHPVFAGLPANCLMGQDYQNVCATQAIVGLPGKPIVAAISWSYRKDDDDVPDYRGPRYAWWGSDLTVLPHGHGYLVLSTLQLINNLGKDPLADRILFNLIRYAAQLAGNGNGTTATPRG